MHGTSRAAVVAILTGIALTTKAVAGPTTLPVGFDAYRQWDSWPLQRIGCRASMRSTYDRAGGNEGADASHFLYQVRPDFNVTLDVNGGGVLYFVRTNHWHGSPWHYEVDGTDHVVSETSTADPVHPAQNSTFLPADVFPEPLAWTWATTKGADLSWVPIEFQKSLRLAYSRTHYGTGYYIYHQFAPGTPLSHDIGTFNGATPPPSDVLELLRRSGSDLSPPSTERHATTVRFAPGAAHTVFDLRGPATLRALTFDIPKAEALKLSSARLRITWDGRRAPSVDAPLSLFFGAGLLYNRDDREYLVKSFPMTIRYQRDRVRLACYFPMPFFKSAKIELLDCPVERGVDISAEARTLPLTRSPSDLAYFHATYRDQGAGERGKDLVLLDTHGTEGSRDWSGSFVGTSFTFTDRGNLTTLEGDPRFFFDDAQTPQAYGTGTEEWGGGGDYWGGRTMTLPLAGHPTGCPKHTDAKSPEDLVHSAYRFLLADLFPFGKNARIQLEHGGINDSEEHYRTVAYWYGLPAPSVVRTDELDVGDAASEHAHAYASPDASDVQTITSRFELGPDTLSAKKGSPSTQPTVVYPPHHETERHTRGTSEFTLKIRPDNRGVFLRRTLDYGLPNQTAEISVADASNEVGEFQPVGTWYLAGSNTCYYSNPKGELDPAGPKVQTSNRRFRDDEFLLPLNVTQGRSAIRVRVRFVPVDHPLLPGQPAAPSAWSEIGYSAYCWVTPRFPTD